MKEKKHGMQIAVGEGEKKIATTNLLPLWSFPPPKKPNPETQPPHTSVSNSPSAL